MMKTACLVAALLLSGCAATDALYEPAVLGPGDTLCTSPVPETCAQLDEMAARLHTPEMDAAIAAAKPGVPRD